MERSQRAVQLYVRLDEPLHQQLVAEAKRQLRSLNREMVYRLRKSFEEQKQLSEPAS
jgi:predicted HicB family RNase H-like nuclease